MAIFEIRASLSSSSSCKEHRSIESGEAIGKIQINKIGFGCLLPTAFPAMGFFQTDEAAATISALKLQLREAEDVHRLKDQLNDSLERQLANSAREVEKLEQELAAKGSLIEAIHKEQVEFPISNRDLLDRLKRYEETWENLADYLTCPICYQPFSAGKTVVLFCGHAFCSQCQLDWESTSFASLEVTYTTTDEIPRRTTSRQLPFEFSDGSIFRGRLRGM